MGRMEPSTLQAMAPRRFVILHEIEDQTCSTVPAVAGWGIQLSDRVVFVWCDPTEAAAVSIFSSADRVLWMADLIAPAVLVWIDPVTSTVVV